MDRCRPTAFDSTQQPHRQHDELSRPALCTEQLPDARGPSARNGALQWFIRAPATNGSAVVTVAQRRQAWRRWRIPRTKAA